ncbi:RNA polymerase sigma factor (fragment) [Moritella yayanosii]|uniref:RNA polymerase sigma factor n=1 Tax=Moritella yayanosii TaxID=69539 RepID=A0A330LTA2_9GAMM
MLTDIHGLSGSRLEKETIFYASFNTACAEQAVYLSQLATRLKQHEFADVSWGMSHVCTVL